MLFGAAGTTSRAVKPVPAVNVTLSAVDIAPNKRSPLAVVVRFPLFGDVFVLDAAAVPSSEFDAATLEYSEIAKRKGPETDIVTVMVLAPLLIFSA